MTVRELRDALGMSRKEFARALALSERTVMRWEDGDSEPVGLPAEVLRGIRRALKAGVPAQEIADKLGLGLGAFLYFSLTN